MENLMSILLNPVLISVVLMCVLCVLKVNVMISIILSTLVAGLMVGMPIIGDNSVMEHLTNGMVGNAETALSYVLFGTLAYAIQNSGLVSMLSVKIEKLFGKSAKIFLLVLAFISCLSQNLIPIHIAFIPILVPSLLTLMNSLKIDRRAAATSLTFGLKAPYILLPLGYGLLFHDILATAMTENGIPFSIKDVWKVTWLPALAMFIGLLISIFITYAKPREYKDVDLHLKKETNTKLTKVHIGAIVGAVVAFAVQIWTKSMPLSALAGIIAMVPFGTIPLKKMDDNVSGGVSIMGSIAFVMLVAAGYGAVLKNSGAVDSLIKACSSFLVGNKLVAAIIMIVVGMTITMGIGTSFGTVPIIATIYVPLGIAVGFTTPQILVLLTVSGAVGDAASPASDSTLGPTLGLNADGQHDHIRDTCIPNVIHFSIPLIISGLLGALVIFK